MRSTSAVALANEGGGRMVLGLRSPTPACPILVVDRFIDECEAVAKNLIHLADPDAAHKIKRYLPYWA